MSECVVAGAAGGERPVAARLARPLLHGVHLVTFAALLLSGLLLLLPDLRAATVGGYSLLIRRLHCWIGVAFVVLPALVVLLCGARNVQARPEVWTLRVRWQALHVATTVALGALFTLSGVVIWVKTLAPDALLEASHLTHVWLTYGAAVLVAAHVVETGIAALLARVAPASAAAARQAPP